MDDFILFEATFKVQRISVLSKKLVKFALIAKEFDEEVRWRGVKIE